MDELTSQFSYEIGIDFKYIETIDKGAFGTVIHVIEISSNKDMAIKVINKVGQKVSLINKMKEEISILRKLNHENIVKFFGFFETNNQLLIKMEYIKYGTLSHWIKNHNKISEEEASIILRHVLSAVIYLHSKHICHRDIKLENILVMKNDIIKIIDFGFAVKCNKDSYQKLFCGTPSYMAPEILNKKKYSPYYSDIWSLGVLFYAMIYGKFPFDYNNKDIDDEFEEITEINIKFYDEINDNENIKNIFKRIFILEPKERVSLNEILDILFKNIKKYKDK